jgi:dUTP pyrophosphatase
MKLFIQVIHQNVINYYSSQKESDDSGLDLVCPETVVIPAKTFGTKIKLGIKCEPQEKHGYYLYPRSSIYKTPIRLANSVGIIDYGYRGEIMAVVDNLSDNDYEITENTRLFQLVGPDLKPIQIELVSNLSKTNRGEGGFGSSGDKGNKTNAVAF